MKPQLKAQLERVPERLLSESSLHTRQNKTKEPEGASRVPRPVAGLRLFKPDSEFRTSKCKPGSTAALSRCHGRAARVLLWPT
eukprot:3260973-Rhodomonas_salina.1